VTRCNLGDLGLEGASLFFCGHGFPPESDASQMTVRSREFKRARICANDDPQLVPVKPLRSGTLWKSPK
jgi:hypothetical protein